MRRAQLITASCTTGWLDWIHSEVWLFDDGLLVAKSGLLRTILNRSGPTVGSTPTIREFTSDEIALIERSTRLNMWLDASTLTSARFQGGLMARGVTLDAAGASVKLLWLPSDHPEGPLRAALANWGVSISE